MVFEQEGTKVLNKCFFLNQLRIIWIITQDDEITMNSCPVALKFHPVM